MHNDPKQQSWKKITNVLNESCIHHFFDLFLIKFVFSSLHDTIIYEWNVFHSIDGVHQIGEKYKNV